MKSYLLLIGWFLLAHFAGWADPVDITALNKVLQGFVRDGKVDYSGIRQNRRRELAQFVNSLAETEISKLSKTEQIAYWLNAYNGLVIYQVVEERGTPESAFSRGSFFRRAKFRVAGQERSLDDIEHNALRPLAQDPRVHFVLVCGAQSCPPLRASAFVGTQDLEATLEQAASAYINDPKNVFLDRPNRRLILNKIFDWYSEDFGDLITFVSRYRSAEERQWLSTCDWRIDFWDYDWKINQSQP